jgi:hypothetical protein
MSTSPSPAVTTAAEADQLAAQLIALMDRLAGVIEQETALMRAGRLAQALAAAEPKTDLARRYVADCARLRASPLARRLPAARLEALRRRHETFRALVQTSMTVLATAHAVSEGIVRGVSAEMMQRSTPQTYGASGRTNAPSPRTAAPIAVSRSL